ncbi:MAG: sigma-54 dependent transcriptional regulator, partial [Phycisphaerae bacterium]
ETEVILITAYGDERLARDALKDGGAYDYITKPLNLDRIREVVDRAARQAITSRENRALREQLDRAFAFEGIIGSSPEMARIIKVLKQVADSKITILIVGETGTGKELIAQAIHNNSSRRNKPYKVINCAGLTESLLESELFGHVRGAFTGAITDRKGLFEAADGGSLLLDEVGDMPPAMQAKLLRTLENGEIVRVGSNDPRVVDVRVIAATNKDLKRLKDQGEFREDLYYRLAQVTIRVPPLRERREDIPLLVQHIKQAAREHGKNITGICPEALRQLVNYKWEGNVRQLRQAITQMVVLAEQPQLRLEDIPEEFRVGTEIVRAPQVSLAGMSLEELERLAIQHTLQRTGGNRERAAKILGIGARTLYRKLKEYGLS